VKDISEDGLKDEAGPNDCRGPLLSLFPIDYISNDSRLERTKKLTLWIGIGPRKHCFSMRLDIPVFDIFVIQDFDAMVPRDPLGTNVPSSQ